MNKIFTPNFITVLRLILTVIGVVILFSSNALIPRIEAFFILFIAALTDIYDGWLARKYNLITPWGKILDPIADKALTLGVMWAFSYLKLYSVYWVILIAIREIVVTGIRLRILQAGKALAAETLGKVKTISQCVSLLVSFFYLFSRDHLVHWDLWPKGMADTLAVGNYLFLMVAVVLTLWSGVDFFVKLTKVSK